MSTFTFWPYDEVSLELKQDQLSIIAPWMKATTSTEPFDKHSLLTLSAKFSEKNLAFEDLALVNDVFRHFHQYPLVYILPASKDAMAKDKHAVLDKMLINANAEQTLHLVGASKQFSTSEIESLLSLLPRRHLEWDLDSALQFASIEGKVHPESFFSIARRFHLIELMAHDRGHEIFQAIPKLSPESSRSALCQLVRQNHYVTEKCQEALEPALALAQQASPIVQAFMSEERGHDKILKKALFHLGAEPEAIEISIQTKVLMALLQYCAERNFLAFAMAVDAFERSNYEEVDPIARLLQEGGFDKAASFINLHMKINDHGEHENVAQGFLKFMDLCGREYAAEALRLMELLSLIMSRISQSSAPEVS